MQYLQRLPLILALAGSLFSGLISSLRLRANNEVISNMLLTMVIFYFSGLFIRSTVLNIKMQVDKKWVKQEAAEKAQREKEEVERKKKEKTEDFLGKSIDYTTNDLDDDSFEPLPVSEFIRNELKDN
ncbi:MAG: hypothetical protein PHC69_05190 [Ruminiclostridium sp.]|nr:hypothetical protein [Ruminiclostridium sp.]